MLTEIFKIKFMILKKTEYSSKFYDKKFVIAA